MNFSKISSKIIKGTGHPVSFFFFLLIVIVWLVFGFITHWSTNHALFMSNVGTPVTLLLVFLIQNAQNRDSLAQKVQIAALIKALKQVDNKFVDLDDLTEEELNKIMEEMKDDLGKQVSRSIKKARS